MEFTVENVCGIVAEFWILTVGTSILQRPNVNWVGNVVVFGQVGVVVVDRIEVVLYLSVTVSKATNVAEVDFSGDLILV